MKKSNLILLCLILLFSCEKKIQEIDPFFTFSKDTNGVVQFSHDIANATSFEWDFGDGAKSTESTPSHQYAKNGTYRVVLIAKNKKNQVTKIYDVVVSDAPKPNPKFSYKSAGNGLIEFSNESSGAEGYIWDFGDGTQTSWEINPKHQYTINGTYSVKLTAKNFNGSSELKQNITIADAPKPVADFSITYGSSGYVSFTNLSKNATSYSWSFGNGQTSTVTNPGISYTTNGIYSVVLTAKNQNGESTTTKSVSITNIFVPTTGQVVFWSQLNKTIKIYVNGTYRGLLTKYMLANTPPSCGQEGFVTVTLPQGAYSFNAETDEIFPTKWSGTINVTNGQCRSQQLLK